MLSLELIDLGFWPSVELGLPSTHTISLTRTVDDRNLPTHKTRMADTLPEIKHVVLLMLENRSFDHMLGGLPGVNGACGARQSGPRKSPELRSA